MRGEGHRLILNGRRLFRKVVQQRRSERRGEAYPWGTLSF